MSTDELSAMRFLRGISKTDATILAPPTYALFTPAFTGHRVYYGHWSETPNYGDKIRQWAVLSSPSMPSSVKAAIIRLTQASYYVTEDKDANLDGLPLRKIYSKGQVSIFAIR
jgi:hypothetical protein